jgi:hypothetical protein
MCLLKPTLLAAAFLLLPYSAFSEGGVTGNWQVTFDTPQGANTMTVRLDEDKDKLTGVLTSPFGSVPLTGTISDGRLQLSASVDALGRKFDMLVGAKLAGDELTGTVKFGDFGEFPFTAKRVPPDANAAAARPQAQRAAETGDATGKWQIELTVLGNRIPIVATLQQDGTKVSGALTSLLGDTPVSGTMTGNALKLEFTAQLAPLGQFPVTMSGDLGPDGFVGKASVPGLGEADWTGKRAN